MKEIMTTKKIIATLAIACMALTACEEVEQKTYHYEVISKTTEIGSHYNWFVGKYKTETENVMVVKDLDTKRVFRAEVSDNTYYSFEVGDHFQTNVELFPKH